MKKVLKIISIILLVALTIGGTCYVFYDNLIKQKDAYASINSFSRSADKTEMYNNLSTISADMSHTLDSAIATSKKLDEMLDCLNVYMICSFDYELDNNEIIDKIDFALSKRNELNNIIEEYIAKSSNPLFNKEAGVQTILKELSSYIVRYAEMIEFTNNEIYSKMIENKNSDIKFSMIELYCLTSIDCFNLVSNGGVYTYDNINLLNTHITIDNGVISTTVGEFSYLNNRFIKAYNNINKANFVKDLSANVTSVGTISESSSDSEKTAYYLKNILGL